MAAELRMEYGMATFAWQTWNSGPFHIERVQGSKPGTVILRFHGPFTVRDVYTNLEPLTLNRMLALETGPGEAPITKSILDLTDCPSMDSSGLGMVVTHHVRCRKNGVKLVAAGVGARVRQIFQLTKVDTLFPCAATVEEAESRA